jgi:hypothetical protein
VVAAHTERPRGCHGDEGGGHRTAAGAPCAGGTTRCARHPRSYSASRVPGENPEADDDLRAEPLDELSTPPAKLTIVQGQHRFAAVAEAAGRSRAPRPARMPASHEGKPNSMNLDGHAAIFCLIVVRSRFRYSSS